MRDGPLRQSISTSDSWHSSTDPKNRSGRHQRSAPSVVRIYPVVLEAAAAEDTGKRVRSAENKFRAISQLVSAAFVRQVLTLLLVE